jgi:hypothetical protein
MIWDPNPNQHINFTGIEILDTFYGVFGFWGETNAEFNDIYVDKFAEYTGDPPTVIYTFISCV